MVVEEKNDSMCYMGSEIMPNEVIADQQNTSYRDNKSSKSQILQDFADPAVNKHATSSSNAMSMANFTKNSMQDAQVSAPTPPSAKGSTVVGDPGLSSRYNSKHALAMQPQSDESLSIVEMATPDKTKSSKA